MQNFSPFHIQLRYERERRGWSQAELASKVGSDSKTVTRWENGKCLPRPYHRRALCELFGKEVEEFGLFSRYQTTRDSAPPETIAPVSEERNIPKAVTQSLNIRTRTYQNIASFPPPTHPKTIQQRRRVVQIIYAKLLQDDVTAVVLTGMGGVGKSTLAALVYRYALEYYQAGESSFAVPPLWLTINESVTMIDLVGTLLEASGKPLPDLGKLTPQRQVMMLFHALDSTDNARLIVLDQFENVLDWQTGYALPERPGVGEWLDALNSLPCACKILLTSRPIPMGTRDYPSAQMYNYPTVGLEVTEGTELLRMQGVQEKQATDLQLQTAVTRCDGHAFALTLLASLLRQNRSLNLSLLFEHTLYEHLWNGDIAQNLLDYVYFQQLNDVQRELLIAFSTYREPVSLEACLALMHLDSEKQRTPLLTALRVLLTQHLLQAHGNALYQLHVIVANYARERCLQERKEQEMLDSHSKAAHYYLAQTLARSLSKEQRKGMPDTQPFIEAVWHLCQARLWSEAFDLMQREGLFLDLRRWGGNATLMELYQLLFPLEKWRPSQIQEATILDQLGRVCGTLGKKGLALDYYEHALQIYRALGNSQGESRTLNHIASVQENLGKATLAAELHKQALIIARSIGDRKAEADALNGLAWIAYALGQQEEALTIYEQALHVYRETNNRAGESDAVNGMGLIYKAKGEKQQAFQLIEQALRLRREIKDRMGEGRILNNLGIIYTDLGQETRACECYRLSFLIRKETGDRYGEGIVLYNIGKIYFHQKRYDLALACWLQARGVFEEVQSTRREATQRWIDGLQSKIGREEFIMLLTKMEALSPQLIEQAVLSNLSEPLPPASCPSPPLRLNLSRIHARSSHNNNGSKRKLPSAGHEPDSHCHTGGTAS